jgi:hypothetical protein
MATNTNSSADPPHLTFTPIVGVPTAGTIRTLTSEVYANTRAVYSASGGAQNGHLGIAMSPAAYLARAGEAFILPIHPGVQEEIPAGATGPVITALNRAYDKAVATHVTFTNVREKTKRQILEAIEPTYIAILQDPIFGFADVTITAFLTHLTTTYGTLDATEIEANRNLLSEAWNPDRPLEQLWIHISNIRDIASTSGRPINDDTTIQLTITALRRSGVYDHAIATWEERPEAEHTMANYKTHFIKMDKLRLKRITAQAAGFHGANQATGVRLPVTPPPTPPASTIRSEQMDIHYCWTHGFGTNPNHTSATCSNKKEGHKDDATGLDRKNGYTYINFGNSGRTSRRRE